MSAAISNRQVVGYGVGDFAMNLYWSGTAFFLLYWYTDVAGVPNEVAGFLFFIGSAWDAITDPGMGPASRKNAERSLLRSLMNGISFDASGNVARVDLVGGSDIRITQPAVRDLQKPDQIGVVLNAARLRAEREAEINVQTDDILPFLGAVVNLNPDRHEHTIQMLEAVHSAVVLCHQRVKHMLSVPRPSELDPRVQPMIPVPGHGSCPSGHATEIEALRVVFLNFLAAPWDIETKQKDTFS